MELLLKIIKFGVVGFSGLAIDFGVTYVLKERVHFHKYLANALGFSLAALNNFYFNKIWTFQDLRTDIGAQFASFFLIAVVGLAINTFFLIVFERRFRLSFYLSKALSIGIVVIWNFAMNYYFTFVGI